jgi:hypothetical protein
VATCSTGCKTPTFGVLRAAQILNRNRGVAVALSQNSVQPPEQALWHSSEQPAVFPGTNGSEFRHIGLAGAGFPNVRNVLAAKAKTPAVPAGVCVNAEYSAVCFSHPA